MSNKYPKFFAALSEDVLEDLIDGYCAKGHITILSGEAYVGKTRFVLQLACHLLAGTKWFWTKDIPKKKVLYFTERSAQSVRRDVVDRGLDLSELTVVTILDLSPEEYAFYEKDRYAWLFYMMQLYKPDIVILDTFGHFLPKYAQTSGSMNDYVSMGRAVRELQRMALRCSTAFFLVHHYAKAKEGQEYKSFKQKSSGSTAILGNTLSVWGLSSAGPVDDKTGSSPFIELSALYHHAAPPAPVYFQSDPSGVLQVVSPEQVMQACMPQISDNKSEERRKAVLAILPEDLNSVEKNEFVQKMMNNLGLSKATAYRVLADMIGRGDLQMENTEYGIMIKKPKIQ